MMSSDTIPDSLMSGGAEMNPPLISVRRSKEYERTHLGLKPFIAGIIK